MIRDSHRPRALILALSLSLPATSAIADPWAAPGDARLRHDLQLLADGGIVKAPLTSWPVPWGEVMNDVSAVGPGADLSPHIAAALDRVRTVARAATQAGEWRWHGRVAASARPTPLRRFSGAPREEGELEGGSAYLGERFAMRLQATVVASPDDGKDFRFDGSYVGAVLGNWMLSAGIVDRWWGPGWEGSLIYGTNQRPIPAITLERNYSDPFETPWLAWIGRWRLTWTMGQLEKERQDYPNTRFFGLRMTWKPHDRLEVGLSRSAQWCGDGRPCGFGTFWDLLWGNDNDQPLDEQPGNQLGGFDARWSLPWMPLAIYGQAIGEDEAGRLPSKYLGLIGAETWGGRGDRSWRVHFEYADTACAFYESEPQYGCAYESSIYTDGYRYRGRVLGYPADGDAESMVFGGMLVDQAGREWRWLARNVKINRAGAGSANSLADGPARVRDIELAHSRDYEWGNVELGLGYADTRAADTVGLRVEGGMRGFVSWRYATR